MITVVINDQSYQYPETNDTEWGSIATQAFKDLTACTLQKKNQGEFALENELSFGSAHGIKVLFISSVNNDPAVNGVFRLCNGELIAWRNEDNDGDNTISFDSDGDLIVNGTKVTLHGQIVNADIAAAAGIEESKLALDYSTDSLHTDIDTHVNDTSNPHSVTKAQVLTGDLIVNSDVDASASIDESKLNLDYSTDSLNTAITTHVADTNNPHSVTKAQVLTGDLIVNADVDASAAIVESKLSLDHSTDSLNTAITSHTGNTSNPHSTSVSNLTDTTITSVASGQVLTYDGSKWTNQASASASLTGLTDTNISTSPLPSNGDVLAYDSVSTKWINSNSLTTLDSTVSGHIGNTSNPHSTKVDNLNDTIISSPSDKDVLSYDYVNSKWINRVNSLSNITDTTISSPTNGDVLLYYNGDWINSDEVETHISDNSNPHQTKVSNLDDVTITTPANKELLQYDYANSQWINSNDVWSTIEVNDIANINNAVTDVTLTSSDKRHQIFTATNGFNITLPSTGVLAGERYQISWGSSFWNTYTTPFTLQIGTDTFYVYHEFTDYTFIAKVNNPSNQNDWHIIRNTKPQVFFGNVSKALTIPVGYSEGDTGLICTAPKGYYQISYHMSLYYAGLNYNNAVGSYLQVRKADDTTPSAVGLVSTDSLINYYYYNMPLSTGLSDSGVINKTGIAAISRVNYTGLLKFYGHYILSSASATTSTIFFSTEMHLLNPVETY